MPKSTLQNGWATTIVKTWTGVGSCIASPYSVKDWELESISSHRTANHVSLSRLLLGSFVAVPPDLLDALGYIHHSSISKNVDGWHLDSKRLPAPGLLLL